MYQALSLIPFIQGLAFLLVVNQTWSHRSVNDGALKAQFNAECEKWVLLLLQLIDITGSQAETHLQIFIKGGGVTKMFQGIIKSAVSALHVG